MVANSLAVTAGVRAKSPHEVGARAAADGTITIMARRENLDLVMSRAERTAYA
jgi:zona occludens toxin (predicted ATPase)